MADDTSMWTLAQGSKEKITERENRPPVYVNEVECGICAPPAKSEVITVIGAGKPPKSVKRAVNHLLQFMASSALTKIFGVKMSSTYIVNGYVDIRIKLVDKDIHASQSSSPQDIADLVKMEFENKIGNCDILGHKIMLQEIG